MKLGIVLSTPNAETNWNAFRLANIAIDHGDEVKVFLIGEGVDYEKGNSEKFNIVELAEKFIENDNADILACYTCLKIRKKAGSDICPVSSIKNLYEIIDSSDKIISF
jgi:sulfur relay (sulfurtransferase) complex TusBCD TusD component (DsrE family)